MFTVKRQKTLQLLFKMFAIIFVTALPKAYDYFAEQFEGLLRFTFEVDDTLEIVGEDNTDEKRLLYTCIVAAVQKVYLEKCLEAIAKEE